MENKNKNWIYPLVILGILLICIYSCKKPNDNNNTPTSSTITDIDGNVYHTVTIGTQVWMAENLKVAHYRNGDTIPNVTDQTTWEGRTAGAYCLYNATSRIPYGALYNFYAVSDSRNLAPQGWHVPSDAEWAIMKNVLGGYEIAGGKLKETGYAHWQNPNTGATNETGFTALPGGFRTNSFTQMTTNGYWWSLTAESSDWAYYVYLDYSNSQFDRSQYPMFYGFSVRCLRD